MKYWLYRLWWRTKAIRRLIELTNCKPFYAIQFVNEIIKTTDKFIWVPADPEEFIEFEVNKKMTNYDFVYNVEELQAWYDNAQHGEYACYGIGRPRTSIMQCASNLSAQLFQKRIEMDLLHYLIRKM